MSPKQLVQEWVARFNAADVDGLIKWSCHGAPTRTRGYPADVPHGIWPRRNDLHVENIFENHQWAILEWRDPTGLRGCGFFHVQNNEIVFQRGYFDQLSFFRLQGIPVPETYLGT